MSSPASGELHDSLATPSDFDVSNLLSSPASGEADFTGANLTGANLVSNLLSSPASGELLMMTASSIQF